MFYQSIHFKLEELVSPDIFKKYGDRAWEFLDPAMLQVIDQLREYFDTPLTINNWHNKGTRMFSGFRERGCIVGAENSQHRFGKAADIICNIPAKDMRLKIMEKSRLFPLLTVMEDGVDWLHIDVRPYKGEEIRLIKP